MRVCLRSQYFRSQFKQLTHASTHFCKLLCHRGACEDAGIPGSRCSQPCGKGRESCGHEDLDPCHAPFSCKEEKPCQSETFITCDCQRRKQKVKCLSTHLDPRGPQREPLKCDDECLRQKRNRQLAEALNVDHDHTDDHIPYQDITLKLFRDNTEWAQAQEREFRVFAESNARNQRFKPMKPRQRQFLHTLAEDYGLDSESQDPEPHRHVSIFKGPRFVAAPRKTLMQCLRILKTSVPPSRATTTAAAPPSKPSQQPYNALLLSRPRFGLTTEEVASALAADLATATGPHPALRFVTSFLPSDEVLIRATTKTTVASIASGALSPTQIDALLTTLKPKVVKAVAAHGLAAGVSLCAVDAPSSSSSGDASSSDSVSIVRREGADGGSGSVGGWSTVASRGAARPRQWAPAAPIETKQTGFVALRRLGAKKPSPPSPPPPPQQQQQSQEENEKPEAESERASSTERGQDAEPATDTT